MGIAKSAYEKRGVRCFYKLSPAESKMIKKAWYDIDVNLQYHGNGFISNFCEKYPQYIIYFTNEPRHPLNVDVAMTSTASVVLESMSYFLLNYYDKINKFDRLIGYLAMYHKDMGLVEEDISNFMECLLNYLIRVNPAMMTPLCQKALKKYFYCIQDEFCSRMEEYREFDLLYFNKYSVKRSINNCLFCQRTIYGCSISLWENHKKVWTEKLERWRKETQLRSSSSLYSTQHQQKMAERFELNSKYREDDELLRRKITENYVAVSKPKSREIKYPEGSSKNEKTGNSKISEDLEFDPKRHNVARQRRRDKSLSQ